MFVHVLCILERWIISQENSVNMCVLSKTVK